MPKGSIRVETENIFPIIKKFLYSDHDIFIRELISNAVDATQKLKMYASSGELKGDLGDTDIHVKVDKETGTITISDKGVGMTAEEVDKYINQVAFSGAEEFLKKYEGKTDTNIIGHFGLGFYSAFMVSGKVEILTLSYKEGAKAVRWICDGSPEYSLEDAEKPGRGTDIILHINEDSKDFLDDDKIENILKRFCRFLPVPIFLDGEEEDEEKKEKKAVSRQINNTTPVWVRKPSELTDDDYKNFYKELYPFAELPLFWIHLNVDYPFHLTGVLYFPKVKSSYEVQKDKIQLYSNQVFVTDEVKDIVPEFLMLLHGVIDSPDIPLNVSRSYLQGDPNVRKINSYITRKVADKLDELFTKDRTSYEEKWESIGLFVKYGMITDDKFSEKAKKFLLFQETKDKFDTLEEYKTETGVNQKNKEGKYVVVYTTDPVQQSGFIRGAEDHGYKVVKMETLIDAAFISNIEMKWQDTKFVRVDSEIAENLINVNENEESVLNKTETDRLEELFKTDSKNLHATVKIKGLSPQEKPVVAVRPEFMRRMKDMAAVNGGGMSGFYDNMPDEVDMVVNGNHPIYKKILGEQDEGKQKDMIRNLADMALLSQGLLKGEELSEFIDRSIQLMGGKEKGRIITDI